MANLPTSTTANQRPAILDSTAREVKVAAFDRRENIRPQLEELSVNGSEYGAARFLVPLGALLIGTLLLVGLYHSAIWFWHVLVH